MADVKSSRRLSAGIHRSLHFGSQGPPKKMGPDATRRHFKALLVALKDFELQILLGMAFLREANTNEGQLVARLLKRQVTDRLSAEIEHTAKFCGIPMEEIDP